jgi:protein-tyrosine-phosphatase
MKTVLFVCVNNARRSQMAAAIFNHFATNATAESAGTMPAEKPDPRVADVLAEIGIVPKTPLVPRKVTDEMLRNADLIVSFDCLAPQMFPREKFIEWEVMVPQTLEEYRLVRDELVEKIKALIAERGF